MSMQVILQLCGRSIPMRATVWAILRLAILARQILSSLTQAHLRQHHQHQLLHLQLAVLVVLCLRALLNARLSHQMCTRRASLYASIDAAMSCFKSDSVSGKSSRGDLGPLSELGAHAVTCDAV